MRIRLSSIAASLRPFPTLVLWIALAAPTLVVPPAACQTPIGGVDVWTGGSVEPTIAVNPLDPDNIAVASIFFIVVTLRVSTDGGATFSAPTFFPPVAAYRSAGDPSIAFDSQGRLFWTYLGLRNANPSMNFPDVFISQIDPATVAVLPGYSVNVSAAAGLPASEGHFNDKEWIAIDRFEDSPYRDRIYVVWTDKLDDFGGIPPTPSGAVVTSFSTDQGITWSEKVSLFTELDGFPDLLAHFRVAEAGISSGDVEVCLRGERRGGARFAGCDAIDTLAGARGARR